MIIFNIMMCIVPLIFLRSVSKDEIGIVPELSSSSSGKEDLTPALHSGLIFPGMASAAVTKENRK